ncbi:hypothetical protein BJ508DRAFT_174115 [Ascobolus immersus RN42]|uniref:Amino acid transporter n=1 Tax=Ascobolus immersus RN42 TaxID=1160509 RepID=A0A3N4HZ14_ASCIM|nr:hypothetical protein BJ508DRAFT_174115 [Ascobolus immersus RN42]
MANTGNMDFDDFDNGSNESLTESVNHAYNAIEVNKEHPEAPNLASEVIIHNPPLEDKWGRFDIFALLVDKKIGTGLFSTPALLLSLTQSVGATLLVFFAAFLIELGILVVYTEFGFAVPRFRLGGRYKSVPRSGGEKNYFEYLGEILHLPRFLATCIYAVVFITVGNTSGNAISFAYHVLEMAGCDPVQVQKQKHFQGTIKGIAVALVTVVCLFHGTWRVLGRYLNKTLAAIKVTMVIFIICVGFDYARKNPNATKNFTSKNLFSTSTEGGLEPANRGTMDWLSRYSQAIILAFYSYLGSENGNYILSEVKRPRKRFARTVFSTFFFVTFLNFMTYFAYFLVMTKPEIMQSKITLAVAYIGKVYTGEVKKASQWDEPACGVCNSNPHNAQIAISGFVALSAFGNIVIVTYIASRVKQEIAKEGILPFSSFFARDYISPIYYILRLLPRYKKKPEALEQKLERTPAGGIFLHWLFSVILIVSPPNPQDGYQLLVYLHAYVMAWFGFILAVGMIYLYRRKAEEWINLCRPRGWVPWGSGLPYAILTALGLLPVLILGWFPRSNDIEDDTNEFDLSTRQCSRYPPAGLHWALSPGLGMGLFAGGVIYWIAFAWLVPMVTKRKIRTVRIAVINTNEEREPYMVKEFIFIRWVSHDDILS